MLIKECIHQNQLGALAVYIKLKHTFNKTIYYNYSVAYLSRKTGISYYLLKKYLPVLLENGWAVENSENLIISSFRKVDYKSKDIAEIKPTTVSDIVHQMRYAVVQQKLLRQKFMADLFHNRIKTTSFRALKKLNKKYPKASGDDTIRTSYRSISRSLNISLSTAHRFLQKVVADGWMRIETEYTTISGQGCGVVAPIVIAKGLLFTNRKNQLTLISGTIVHSFK